MSLSEEMTPKHGKGDDEPRINEVAQKFLADMEEERIRLGNDFPICSLLIDEALERVYSTGRIPGKEFYADIYKQKPLKIVQKVFVPVKQYPKFNFTGKILGPKGNSLRRLQQETQCKIAIKGRHSVRDRNKEEEMRNSGDPRYAHLHKDLFIEISTISSPAESYARVAYALAELRKYIVPDKNDEVSHEQYRELLEVDPSAAKQSIGSAAFTKRSVYDRKFTTHSHAGAPKYMNLIKPVYEYAHEHPDEHAHEHEEELYEYDHRVSKRPVVSPYETYIKPRTVAAPSVAAYKRAGTTVYPTEIKRTREAPPSSPSAKSYKPSSYGILKKY